MQITKYKWEKFEPTLIFHGATGFSKMKLLNSNISLNIGERICIGFWKEGVYHECPDHNKTEFSWSCPGCIKKDDYFRCMQCDGSECINEKNREGCMQNNYYIYLAAFDSVLKVGISYEHRFLERLVEQGADLCAKIAFVRDGKNVRVIEQKIKDYLGIVDRISGKDKHGLIFGDPNKAATNISAAIKRLKNGFQLNEIIEPEIYDLRGYYHLQNIFMKPEVIDIDSGTNLTGKVIAAKGNILVLENNGFHSVNSHSLIGRMIENV